MSDDALSAASEVDGINRREFLKQGGVFASGLLLSKMPIMAGPFAREDWNDVIPLNKRLDANWLRSLTERGEPTAYRKSRGELKFIGMPVGGICCGTLYLGGDGRLWNWDIFNQNGFGVLPRDAVRWSEIGMNFGGGNDFISNGSGANYVRPATLADSQPIEQGFAIRIETEHEAEVRRLDATGWSEVTFTGTYPIGTVTYSDPRSPVSVVLEAFSPFIPGDADDSGLPATVFHISIRNHGETPVSVELLGWMQNACNFYTDLAGRGTRTNELRRSPGATQIEMHVQVHPETEKNPRSEIVFDDFSHGYDQWRVEGTAFGSSPILRKDVPAYQGDLGGEGDWVVNSHSTAPGASIEEKDNQKGKLTSKSFVIQRKFIAFYIGGGKRSDVGLRLLVDGKPVRTASGDDSNRMRLASFEVSEFEGKSAVIEIFDDATGPWGNVGVAEIVQTDHVKSDLGLAKSLDFGSLCLALLGSSDENLTGLDVEVMSLTEESKSADPSTGSEAPIGRLGRKIQIAPGEREAVRFVLAWHFPNASLPVRDSETGNYYSKRFANAGEVAGYVAKNIERLESTTRLWRDTWYDSTLPYWFLDRSFATVATLATSTAHRFVNGRFWAWEGVGCCEGTCTHVWHYAQAVGRLFPEIERGQREHVDFGVALETSDGIIGYRGEGTGPAIDGQCGRLLGVWREHQMSSDNAFLTRIYPKVKIATGYVLQHLGDDGILTGAQENTLDAAWFGKIAWTSSLAVAAFRAVAAMAREQGDASFASLCESRADQGRASIERELFNGEYFIQLPDPSRPKSLGTYQACHIDQVHGQSWAWQVSLGRILDREKTLSALEALWKYNFTPDVGPFRQKYKSGRPYALAGDGGLIMSSNPKEIPDVYRAADWQSAYFNECMSGFEHQVASHMVAEGMVQEGLAVTRAIHDRYHASRRNPYNEIECSDHYSRAMAAYGTFISMSGFETHGPNGHLGFAPRIGADRFQSAFTVAGGWGSYRQRRSGRRQIHEIAMRHGEFLARSLAFELPEGKTAKDAVVRVGHREITTSLSQDGIRVTLTLGEPVRLSRKDALRVQINVA